MKYYISVIIIVLFAWVPVCNALTMEELLKACGNETIVFNKKGEQVGQKLDGYCSGYLLGALESLALVDPNICIKDKITPEHLLSVLKTYIKEKGGEENAQETLRKAFTRAFSCN